MKLIVLIVFAALTVFDFILLFRDLLLSLLLLIIFLCSFLHVSSSDLFNLGLYRVFKGELLCFVFAPGLRYPL